MNISRNEVSCDLCRSFRGERCDSFSAAGTIWNKNTLKITEISCAVWLVNLRLYDRRSDWSILGCMDDSVSHYDPQLFCIRNRK